MWPKPSTKIVWIWLDRLVDALNCCASGQACLANQSNAPALWSISNLAIDAIQMQSLMRCHPADDPGLPAYQ